MQSSSRRKRSHCSAHEIVFARAGRPLRSRPPRPDGNVDAFVGTDNAALGRKAGELTKQALNGKEAAPPQGAIAAGDPLITSENVKDILKFKKSFLRRLRPAQETLRDDWHRFVLVKVDARDGMSMYPRILPGASILIDRHYNSLKPYRKGESNMYAVARAGGCTLKYVEVAGNHLVLRPHNQAYPVEVMPMESSKKVHDYLIGRISYVGIET